jgi:RNA polymerase sigma factor (sigma-70 family)
MINQDGAYRVLGSWEGRSSLSTFLTVVLVNLMRDYRTHIWGRWRSSAAARRQGPDAELLERLCARDGLSLDEAIERMRTEHGVLRSRAELEQMAAELPHRTDRGQVSEEELVRVPVDGKVESRVEDGEHVRTAVRLRQLLLPLLESLPAEEHLLLKLHYWEGLSIAAISSILGRPQKELYRVRERCKKKLRRSLEGSGMSSGLVLDLLDSRHLDLALDG